MKINLYGHPVNETFLQPMVDYIRGHGGQVIYNVDIEKSGKENGAIIRVVSSALPGDIKQVRRCAVCGNLVFDGMEIDGECPHCGARADMLQYMNAEEAQGRKWQADYFISAVDIPAAKTLVESNRAVFGDDPYFTNILDLKTQSVYVTQLWYEGKGFWEEQIKDFSGKRPGFSFFATGFKYLALPLTAISACRSPMLNSPFHLKLPTAISPSLKRKLPTPATKASVANAHKKLPRCATKN